MRPRPSFSVGLNPSSRQRLPACCWSTRPGYPGYTGSLFRDLGLGAWARPTRVVPLGRNVLCLVARLLGLPAVGPRVCATPNMLGTVVAGEPTRGHVMRVLTGQ